MENLELNQNNQNGTASQSDTNTAQTPQTPKLSEYLESQKRENNEIKSYTDEQGRTIFVPKNEQRKEKQLDALVNCIDDYCEKTNELISLELIDTREVKTMKNLFRDSPRKNYKGIEKCNFNIFQKEGWLSGRKRRS